MRISIFLVGVLFASSAFGQADREVNRLDDDSHVADHLQTAANDSDLVIKPCDPESAMPELDEFNIGNYGYLCYYLKLDEYIAGGTDAIVSGRYKFILKGFKSGKIKIDETFIVNVPLIVTGKKTIGKETYFVAEPYFAVLKRKLKVNFNSPASPTSLKPKR
jgi:hypothetical protein